MDNKILRNSDNTIFEPHILTQQELPFIYHLDLTCGRRICNFHENLELLFFLDGSGHVEYENKRYNTAPGDLIVINSYAVHQVVSDAPMKYVCLIIDNSFCRYHGINISKLHFTEWIHDERFQALFQRLIEERSAERPFTQAAVKLAVLDILLLLCRSYSREQAVQIPVNESSQKYIRSAIQYIKMNISRKLSVEEISAAVGLSQYHFMREFKQFTGTTLTKYINLIRCEYAKELLQTGQYKIKDVAHLCGFESESYFINVFKKHTQTLPSEHLNNTQH